MSKSIEKDARDDPKERNNEAPPPPPPSRSIRTPEELVAELKRNGKFDDLWRAMRRDFMKSRKGEAFQDFCDDKIDDELDHLHPTGPKCRGRPLDRAEAIKEIMRGVDKSSAYSRAQEDFDHDVVTDWLRDIESDLKDTLRKNRQDVEKGKH